MTAVLGQDEVLMERVKLRSDPRAFEELYKKYFPEIYSMLRMKRIKAQDARDATQEVFLNAWKYKKSFNNEEGSLKSWLYGIAKNELHKESRDEVKINNELKTRIEESLKPGGVIDLTDKLKEQIEVQDIIKWAISQLTGEEKELIALRFFLGWNYKEIAKELNTSEDAARQMVHRIILKLRKILGDRTNFLEEGS